MDPNVKEENLSAETIWALFKETDRKFLETDKLLNQKFQETEKLLNQKFQETDKKFKETDIKFRETDKQVRIINKNVGGLNNKFGSFTKGLFMPSLRRILTKDMGFTNFNQNVSAAIGGNDVEIDVLAYSNGTMNIAFVVEIKSHLKIEHIQQTLNIIQKFKTYFPEHNEKKLCGMIAAITFTNDLREEVLSAGLYFAHIHNKTFQIDVPENFQPKYFN